MYFIKDKVLKTYLRKILSKYYIKIFLEKFITKSKNITTHNFIMENGIG